MARFLRARAAPGDRVIARKPHLAYYSGVPDIAFPFADSLADLARFAQGRHVRWLYFAWPEAQTRPRLSYLLDTAAVVPGLTPRVVTRHHASVLYEIGPRFGEPVPWMGNDTLVTWHLARSQLLVDPDHADALFAVAMVAAAQGRPAEARTHLVRLTHIAPASAAPWLLLGEVALRQGDAACAEESFRHVLALDSGNGAAAAGLGYVSLMRGHPDRAAAAWRGLGGPNPDPEAVCRLVFQATRNPRDVARIQAALALPASRGGPAPLGSAGP